MKFVRIDVSPSRTSSRQIISISERLLLRPRRRFNGTFTTILIIVFEKRIYLIHSQNTDGMANTLAV